MQAMREALLEPETLSVRAGKLRERVAAGFSVESMARTIDEAYSRALAWRAERAA